MTRDEYLVWLGEIKLTKTINHIIVLGGRLDQYPPNHFTRALRIILRRQYFLI